MIRHLHIENMGPHRVLDYAPEHPAGRVTIMGPSQQGKTTLIDAICFCLWGVDREGRPFDPALVYGDERYTAVTINLTSGAEARRRRTRSGQVRRVWVSPRVGGSGEMEYSNEADFRVAMRALGRERICRSILVPFSWLALAEGEGGGRPLRDLLAGMVPEGVAGLVRRSMGADWREDMPLVESLAVEARRAAGGRLDAAGVRVLAASERLARAVARMKEPAADGEAIARSQATVDAGQQWAAHDLALARHRLAHGRQAEVEAWDTATAEIKEARAAIPPMADLESAYRALFRAHEVRSETLAAANRSAQSQRAILQETERRIADARVDAGLLGRVPCTRLVEVTLDGASISSLCPLLSKARAAQESQPALDAERATAQAALQVAETNQQAAVAQEARDRADMDRAKEDATRARLVHDHLDARERALGTRPEVLAAEEPPAAPEGERPTSEAVTVAKALIVSATRRQGARERDEQEHAEADTSHKAAIEVRTTLEREVAVLDRLVEVLRAAPATLAEMAIAGCGDLGPVTMVLVNNGVQVLVDGRPAREPLVSRGRLTYADALLRAGLRRLANLPWLPLFIDNGQDWSEDFADVPAPVVVLRTTGGPDNAMEVSSEPA
jgi:hypothetical protein